MDDDDLYLLMDEEMRLYRAYRLAAEEESRRPQVVEQKRLAWADLYGKLESVLTPERRRELLQARVNAAQAEVKTRRGR